MGKFVILLAFILILTSAFAQEASQCDPGFDDTLTIRTLDGKLRPIEGAQVNLTYQKDFTSGKGYFTTRPFFTNSSGTVSIFVKNVEQLMDKVDCEIIIRALYNNNSMQVIAHANSHPALIDLNFDAFIVTIRVVDQRNEPILGADVFVNEIKKKTDETGTVFFPVMRGTSRVFVSYGQGKVERVLDVQDDQLLSLGISFYNMTISAKDDNLNPLEDVTIELDDKQYATGTDGMVKINDVFGSMHALSAHYGIISKKNDVNLVLQKDYELIFDINAPEIKSVTQEESGNNIILKITASDGTKRSSGIDAQGVTVAYSVNSGAQEKATVYVRTNSEFSATIPKPAPGSLISFTVAVPDKESNKKVLEGKIKIPDEKPSDNSSVQPPATPPSSIGSDIHIPWELVVGIIIVAVVIFFVSRLRKDEMSP